MNKVLMSIAVSVLSFTSVSYGSDDVLSTPTISGSTVNSTPPADLTSVRSSQAEAQMRGRYQKFTITESTTRDDLISRLICVENEVISIQENVIVYLKDLACILTTDATLPVKPHSEHVKSNLIKLVKLVKSLQSGEDRVILLEAENRELAESLKSCEDRVTLLETKNRELEKTLRQWKHGVIVSVVVLAFIYQNVLNYGHVWLSFFINSWNFLVTK